MAEKSLDITALILTILVIEQMYVYKKFYDMTYSDERFSIFLMSLISNIDMFIHYSFMTG